MNIAGHEIGREPFIIAEAGLNHNGSIKNAMEMVRAAKRAGCTAVKFQTFKAEGVCDDRQMYSYRSQGKNITEPRINIFKRAQLPVSAWPILKAVCEKEGIIFLSTPQNPSDLAPLLHAPSVTAIKIGSDDLTNLPMLRECAKTKLPVILSCGMSYLNEVHRALTQFDDVAMLVCTSEYPCKSENVNITRISALRAMYPYIPIGLSDHTQGNVAACMAVALGASIFEKHFTLDHGMPGPDHHWSTNQEELGAWLFAIKSAWRMRGDGIVRPSLGEDKEKYQRSVA